MSEFWGDIKISSITLCGFNLKVIQLNILRVPQAAVGCGSGGCQEEGAMWVTVSLPAHVEIPAPFQVLPYTTGGMTDWVGRGRLCMSQEPRFCRSQSQCWAPSLLVPQSLTHLTDGRLPTLGLRKKGPVRLPERARNTPKWRKYPS